MSSCRSPASPKRNEAQELAPSQVERWVNAPISLPNSANLSRCACIELNIDRPGMNSRESA